MTNKMTVEEAEKIIQAVMGDNETPVFATEVLKGGDVAIIMRADGGIEIASVMFDNPDKVNLASLGLRGMFALALFKLAHSPELMRDTLLYVSNELNSSPPPMLHS